MESLYLDLLQQAVADVKPPDEGNNIRADIQNLLKEGLL